MAPAPKGLPHLAPSQDLDCNADVNVLAPHAWSCPQLQMALYVLQLSWQLPLSCQLVATWLADRLIFTFLFKPAKQFTKRLVPFSRFLLLIIVIMACDMGRKSLQEETKEKAISSLASLRLCWRINFLWNLKCKQALKPNGQIGRKDYACASKQIAAVQEVVIGWPYLPD